MSEIKPGMVVRYKNGHPTCRDRTVIGTLDGYVYMRVGDNPCSCDSYMVDEFWERYEEVRGEWWLFAEDGNECDSVKNCHHYRKPTVEDVLFSYRQDCIRAHEEAVSKQARDEMLQRIDAEYADKLREAMRDE